MFIRARVHCTELICRLLQIAAYVQNSSSNKS